MSHKLTLVPGGVVTHLSKGIFLYSGGMSRIAEECHTWLMDVIMLSEICNLPIFFAEE